MEDGTIVGLKQYEFKRFFKKYEQISRRWAQIPSWRFRKKHKLVKMMADEMDTHLEILKGINGK